MNNSLLKDPEYNILITNTIINLETDLSEITDARLSWEYLKMVIRRETVAYSISKHKKRQKEGKDLLDQLQASEAKHSQASGSKEDLISEYRLLKKITKFTNQK